MTLNTISEQLKQHALQAPFLLEKQNYLMAVQEIDRLHAIIQQLHTCVQDHTVDCHLILQQIKHILQAHAS